MATYTLHIPSFHIRQIRSAHTDTLFASTALKVMNANGSLHHDFGAQGAALGDHKAGGDVVLSLPWSNVDVPDPTPEAPDGGAAYWTFLLMNAGHVDSGYVTVLNKAADSLAGAVAGKLVDAGSVAGHVGVLVAFASILAAQEALNLLTADCDGQVAAGAFALTAAELNSMTSASGSSVTTQNNPGSDSLAGCGENSNYDVTYEFLRQRTLQDAWRFCGKCSTMFFDGFPAKGSCPRGAGHAAIGLEFTLLHDFPAIGSTQKDWRFCHKCNAMFFDGFPSKGVCALDGGRHEAAGFNFVLLHDVQPTPQQQSSWRFCHKCNVLFFDGQTRGACRADGGAHDPSGFIFVLDHK